jgi:FkbM family methyltransferase
MIRWRRTLRRALSDPVSTEAALKRAAGRGCAIATVVDVGASNGMWSRSCRRFWPDAEYLLIEAQKAHEPALQAYCASHPNARYVLAAAGDERGEIYFNDAELFGGVALKAPSSEARSVVPQTTIDHEVRRLGLPGPYLLKLDTHGYELPILKGAAETLRDTRLAMIEVYIFRLRDGSPLFHELVAAMRELGFGVIDMAEPLWRDKDRALWQLDLVFAPLAAPEFADNGFS